MRAPAAMMAWAAHRLAPALAALLVAIAVWSFLTSGAAARAHHPRCGYHVRIVRGYTVRLHKGRTSGVFAFYLIAPDDSVLPYGAVCINVIARRHLPLVPGGSGRLGSWMQIVRNHRTIFPHFGGRPVLVSNGVEITFAFRRTLHAIERCPRCFTFEVWPLGYHGRRPELSAPL